MYYDQEKEFSTVSSKMQNNSNTERSVFIVYNILACKIIGWVLPNMRVLLYLPCTHTSFYKFIAFPIDLNGTLDFSCLVVIFFFISQHFCMLCCLFLFLLQSRWKSNNAQKGLYAYIIFTYPSIIVYYSWWLRLKVGVITMFRNTLGILHLFV